MNRKKAIRIFSRPQNYSADAMKKAIEFAIDFLENHKEPDKPTEHESNILTELEEKLMDMKNFYLNHYNGDSYKVVQKVIFEIMSWVMENHQKPTEHETAQDTEHESMSEGVEMELVALNILNRTFTFLAGEEGFDVREGKYLIKRIDQ